MSTKELIDGAVAHLQNSANVKAVYGTPITTDGKTVIPVARVLYGFGVGSGSGTHARKSKNGKTPAEGEGEGAGGGVAAKPIGVVEITGAETRFVPFGASRKLAIMAVIGAGLGAAFGWFLGRRAGRS
jgi:uncharacterized spore protein YtfJ